MIEYILEYLACRGVFATSKDEQRLLETGISRYLFENGIGDNNTGGYYKNYVNGHLRTISVMDLKAYFLNYSLISDVNQIVIEFDNDGEIPEERKRVLFQLMEKLYSSGLGEKYVPASEIKQILGTFS